jgi:outer membrane protein assembly factor BamB
MGGYISISNDGGSYTQNNWHNDSLIRFDENFNVIWKKPVLDYFTPYSQGYFQIRNLIETPENDIIFSGAFGREDYHRNFWVKVDENGNLIWTYTLAANANAHSVHGTIYRPDGIVMLQAEQPYQVSDNYGNMLWLVKTRPDGTLANEELETNTTINISPNPANENITISFPEIFSGTIEIFNLQGQKVFDTQTENIQQTTINISNLPEGFYLLKTFNNPNNTIATTKFIVN